MYVILIHSDLIPFIDVDNNFKQIYLIVPSLFYSSSELQKAVRGDFP